MQGPTMPTARLAHSACIVDGMIYVIGGIAGRGAVATVTMYDPASETWEEKAGWVDDLQPAFDLFEKRRRHI